MPPSLGLVPLFLYIVDRFEIEHFNLVPRPGSFPQKFETRSNARVVHKTVDLDVLPQFLPSVVFHQIFQNCLKGLPLKRVVGIVVHVEIVALILPYAHECKAHQIKNRPT